MSRAIFPLALLVAVAGTAHAGDSAKDIELEIDGALTEGAYRDALELSEQAIRQHPERASTWTLRGKAEGYTLVAPIFVELVPRDGSWKVVDVVIPSLDSLRLASLMDVAARKQAGPSPAAPPAQAPRPPAQRPANDSETPSGPRLLVMLGGGLAAAVIAFFVLRWVLARSRT